MGDGEMSVDSDEIAAAVERGIANFLGTFLTELLLPVVVFAGIGGILILIGKVFAGFWHGDAGSIVLVLAIAAIAALCAVIWLWCWVWRSIANWWVWRSIANWIREHEARWPEQTKTNQPKVDPVIDAAVAAYVMSRQPLGSLRSPGDGAFYRARKGGLWHGICAFHAWLDSRPWFVALEHWLRVE
jgi:hypothetical protein